MIRYAFETLDLHRLEADVDPRNHASIRCLERLGFRKEGYAASAITSTAPSTTPCCTACCGASCRSMSDTDGR